MAIRVLAIVAALLVGGSITGFASDAPSNRSAATDKTGLRRLVPPNTYPIFGYTSEIGAILGFYNVMSSTPSAPSREVFAMSTGLGYFTFLKLNQLPLTQSLKLEAFYGYSYWKESFHGFGNNTPATPVDDVYAHNGRLNILARYPLGPKKSIALGPTSRFRKENHGENTLSIEPNQYDIGLKLQYRDDGRNKSINPSSGQRYDVAMSYFPSQFSHANESDIVKWELDLKRYFNTGYNTVLATRLFMGQVSGKNPSFMHAFTVGNPSIMRGALPNRYTGNAISSIQTEYRFPIWRFIKGHVFIDAGRTGDEVEFNNLHVGYGYGFFFAFPKSDAGFRFEIANMEGSREVFAMFNYAF